MISAFQFPGDLPRGRSGKAPCHNSNVYAIPARLSRTKTRIVLAGEPFAGKTAADWSGAGTKGVSFSYRL